MRRNNLLLKRAKKHLVGGVNSPVRSFNYVGIDPVLIDKGRGSKIYDYEGNKYIDYVLSYGALILGHRQPLVIKEIKKALNRGVGFGATNISEIELAEIIKGAIPYIDKIRFVNSGTEAVMGAIRLGRAYTNREKIIKFTNAYHGHADYLLTRGGSGLATFNIPLSKGVSPESIRQTIVLEYGDRKAIDKVFKQQGSKIAGVIVEPVGGNYGVIEPDKGFLKHLRNLTKETGALLIFDEVITGFRFRFGSVSKDIGVEPDLTCLGKIIGAGLPIGAYAAKGKIMDKLAPLGGVYQASTFGGNPIVMQAGIAVLRVLSTLRGKYSILKKKTKIISEAIKDAAVRAGINVDVRSYGAMFSVKFSKKKDFQSFYQTLLDEGVYFATSEYEVNFLSFAHTDKDIKKTIAAIKKAMDKL